MDTVKCSEQRTQAVSSAVGGKIEIFTGWGVKLWLQRSWDRISDGAYAWQKKSEPETRRWLSQWPIASLRQL